MMRAEDIVQMALDAQRYRFLREWARTYQWGMGADGPEGYDAAVDELMALLPSKEEQ